MAKTAKKAKQKAHAGQGQSQIISFNRLWQPRAEVCYKQVRNQVQSTCGLKQAQIYLTNAAKLNQRPLQYLQYHFSEWGATRIRNTAKAIYAQIIWNNYQVSRRSIEFSYRPIQDMVKTLSENPNFGKGVANDDLADQCVFIDCSKAGFTACMGDGIFLSIFSGNHSIFLCIHAGEYYTGEIMPEEARDPFSKARAELKDDGMLNLVYHAWIFHGLLTGGLRLADESQLKIIQDLGEITDHTPIKTIMRFDGYDTLMAESSYSLNFLAKIQMWTNNLPELLESMGMHGDDNYLMAKRTKLFFALQAWANVRQTFKVDCDDFKDLGQPLASDIPLSLFKPEYFPYSSFYVELKNYGKKDGKCGVLIAQSPDLEILSGEKRPEVFVFYDGYVFNEYPTEKLFEHLAEDGVVLGDRDEVSTKQENGDIAVPVEFFFIAALAVASILKGSAEEFILREYREVRSGEPVKRPPDQVHDYKWFLKPRTTYPVEKKTEVRVPLDQLIPPENREIRERIVKGTHASPSEHLVRSHYRVYWCGSGENVHPEFRWIKEFVRGKKPHGVVQTAEVIHEL